MKKYKIFDTVFYDDDFSYFVKNFKKKGYLVIPSGPGLSEIYDKSKYKESLNKSTFAIFDSSLLCILLRLVGIRVNKYSGYKFLADFFEYLKYQSDHILLIDPNENEKRSNYKLLNNINKNIEIINYVAPIYQSESIIDEELIKLIKNKKPNFILINLGGFTQEPLANYIINNIDIDTFIICSGAAISFFTGHQANVNNTIDKFYLGWLVRCLKSPLIFIPRYIKALKLIYVFIKHKKGIEEIK